MVVKICKKTDNCLFSNGIWADFLKKSHSTEPVPNFSLPGNFNLRFVAGYVDLEGDKTNTIGIRH